MTQQQEILQILEKCGRAGMNSWLYRRKFIQLPVRIKELKGKGYLIVSKRNEDTSVNYVLLNNKSVVVEEKPKLEWIFENGFAKQVPVNQQQELL